MPKQQQKIKQLATRSSLRSGGSNGGERREIEGARRTPSLNLPVLQMFDHEERKLFWSRMRGLHALSNHCDYILWNETGGMCGKAGRKEGGREGVMEGGKGRGGRETYRIGIGIK